MRRFSLVCLLLGAVFTPAWTAPEDPLAALGPRDEADVFEGKVSSSDQSEILGNEPSTDDTTNLAVQNRVILEKQKTLYFPIDHKSKHINYRKLEMADPTIRETPKFFLPVTNYRGGFATAGSNENLGYANSIFPHRFMYPPFYSNNGYYGFGNGYRPWSAGYGLTAPGGYPNYPVQGSYPNYPVQGSYSNYQNPESIPNLPELEGDVPVRRARSTKITEEEVTDMPSVSSTTTEKTKEKGPKLNGGKVNLKGPFVSIKTKNQADKKEAAEQNQKELKNNGKILFFWTTTEEASTTTGEKKV